MSFKPEVIADSTGEWVGNALRFATEQEALDNVLDLAARWYAVRDTRVVESADPVNYSYTERKLRAVRQFVIVVNQLVADSSLDADDLADKEQIVGRHMVTATDAEHALDLFHASVPIACLEDFEIEAVQS